MLISSLIAGAILNGFSENKAIIGFGIIFATGLIANFISAFYLNKQYEPSYALVDEDSKRLNLNAKPFKKLKVPSIGSITHFLSLVFPSTNPVSSLKIE